MIEKLILIYSRCAFFNKESDIFIKILMLFYLIWVFISLFIAIYIDNWFIILLVLFMLSQYNMPYFANAMKSGSTHFYIYNKRVFTKYLIFQIAQHNPFIAPAIMFLIIEFIVAVIDNDFLRILVLIIGFVVSIIMMMQRLVTSAICKIIVYIFYCLFVSAIIFQNSVLMLLTFMVAVGVLYISIKNIQLVDHEYRETDSTNHITQMNKIILFMWLNIKRRKKRDLMIYTVIIIAYTIFSTRFSLIIDYTFLVVILFLVEIELLIDNKFNHLSKTTSVYYIKMFSNLNVLQKYMLSEFFVLAFLFTAILGLATSIDIYFSKDYYKGIDLLLTIPILFILSAIYSYGERCAVIYKRFLNTLIFQYFLFIGIILYFIAKSFILEQVVSL
ncbi:hypothetical protein K2V61_07025 [Staphylococcus simulans]|uniref:hypothetical protein n=1 Tax=Staphylococcus simulans TaxID=1286 RepID=UPI001E3CB6B9|nr:hypothetical protein [Staphylococcus simulans]MCD8915293.1 hypothetical protein [Staphylococcus simulans]